MFYLILYLIAWLVGIFVYLVRGKSNFIQTLTITHLVICVGIFGIWNFIGHTFMSEQIASTIGWTSNGFQKELGWVSLGIGIAGILCYWIRSTEFWWATIIPYTTFLVGAAIVHITEIAGQGNLNPGNTWIIIPDILMPLTIIVLLVLQRKAKAL